MGDVVELVNDALEVRTCPACQSEFRVAPGSLRQLCSDEVCIARRTGQPPPSAPRPVAQVPVLQRPPARPPARDDDDAPEDSGRAFARELKEVARHAREADGPERRDVTRAVRMVAFAEGAEATRACLLHLAGLCVSWASRLGPGPGGRAPRDDE